MKIPKNAEEIRAFIGQQFISLRYAKEDGKPNDDDVYVLSAHDLLSAFDWACMGDDE